MSLLTVVELMALVAWLGLAAWMVAGAREGGVLVPLDPAALTSGTTQERWYGIFFQDQHVGFAVTRAGATADGGTLYESRSSFRSVTFGKLQEVVTAGVALVDAGGTLRRFDYFMAADPVRLAARGEVREGPPRELVMEVDQAGETSTLRFPVERAPQVDMTLESVVRGKTLAVGQVYEVPYFNPLTLSEGELTLTVTGVEVLENGEEAYWLTSAVMGLETRQLVTPGGETLRSESPTGLGMVRMTREAAQDVPVGEEGADLIAATAVKLQGRIPDARHVRVLELAIKGVEPERIVHQPPLQVLEGDQVRVEVPLKEEIPRLPVEDRSDPRWLEATLSVPAAHPDIVAKARELVGGAADRREATERLVAWVDRYVQDEPLMSVPNGLEVLREARGDCNEHTALFVSLARAAGIPTRIAAGVVYSDRVGPQPAFYYHAWPEVRLGGQWDWLPVDPTFGQFPADATHVKLVEGDLDRQVEIMAVMGRLGFEVLQVR